jgi:hypothetical protein
MNKNIYYFLLIISISCIIFVFLPKQNISEVENIEIVGSCGAYVRREVTVGGKIVKVDVSDTDCKRALGLSGRKLLENH